VNPPIFVCGFVVPIVFATIQPRDQAHPLDYEHQSDERQQSEKIGCRVMD
jgi:hypothetical protein